MCGTSQHQESGVVRVRTNSPGSPVIAGFGARPFWSVDPGASHLLDLQFFSSQTCFWIGLCPLCVSCGCRNQLPQTWLKNSRIYALTAPFLEATSSESVLPAWRRRPAGPPGGSARESVTCLLQPHMAVVSVSVVLLPPPPLYQISLHFFSEDTCDSILSLRG